MHFLEHFNLRGKHAIFSPSSSSWLRYSKEETIDFIKNKKAAELGTKLHAWAEQTINLKIKQPRSKTNTLYMYVNDCIGFRMDTEVTLYYSDACFGTADAISFRNNRLMIFDLKTGHSGKIEKHMEQVEIYAALFCLEYKLKPGEIEMELRVYKNGEVLVYEPQADDILPIMDEIVRKCKIVDEVETEGYLS